MVWAAARLLRKAGRRASEHTQHGFISALLFVRRAFNKGAGPFGLLTSCQRTCRTRLTPAWPRSDEHRKPLDNQNDRRERHAQDRQAHCVMAGVAARDARTRNQTLSRGNAKKNGCASFGSRSLDLRMRAFWNNGFSRPSASSRSNGRSRRCLNAGTEARTSAENSLRFLKDLYKCVRIHRWKRPISVSKL